MPQKISTQTQAPDHIQPELFINISGSLVPSELAAPDDAIFVRGVTDAIKSELPKREMSVQEKMDVLRRARVAQERIDFISSQDQDEFETGLSDDLSARLLGAGALQGQLFFDATSPVPEAQKSRRTNKVAFGRYLKKAVHDVAGEKNSSLISRHERLVMSPDIIAPIIYRNSKKRSEQEGYYVDDILVNQVEYRMLPRSPKHLAISTHAQTLGELDLREDKEVLDRADRSINHVFEEIKPKLQDHLGKLVERYTDLDKLSQLVRNPGFAHVEPKDLEDLISSAWDEFNNMIHVVGVQQKWNPEQIQVAETAIVASFTEGNQNERVKAFANQLRFAKRYVRSRVNLYENRLGVTSSYLPEVNESFSLKTT